MSGCLGEKAKVVQIDRGRPRSERVTDNEHYWEDQLPKNKADLIRLDREILRMAGDNQRNDPAMNFDDAVRKVAADYPEVMKLKREAESGISRAAFEIARTRGGRDVTVCIGECG